MMGVEVQTAGMDRPLQGAAVTVAEASRSGDGQWCVRHRLRALPLPGGEDAFSRGNKAVDVYACLGIAREGERGGLMRRRGFLAGNIGEGDDVCKAFVHPGEYLVLSGQALIHFG